MKQASAAAWLNKKKAAKPKKTKQKPCPRSRREIFLTVTDTLADWLEQKMTARGESRPQTFIYELLQQRREQDVAQAQ